MTKDNAEILSSELLENFREINMIIPEHIYKFSPKTGEHQGRMPNTQDKEIAIVFKTRTLLFKDIERLNTALKKVGTQVSLLIYPEEEHLVIKLQ